MAWFKRRASCGHWTKMQGVVRVFGKELKVSCKDKRSKVPARCIDCTAAKAILCAWCRSVILPGDPVTLYSPIEEDFEIPPGAVIYNDESRELIRPVGCLGWDCADTGADRAGFWAVNDKGEGYVHRVPTAFELLMNAPSGGVILVQDLRDLGEEPTIL